MQTGYALLPHAASGYFCWHVEMYFKIVQRGNKVTFCLFKVHLQIYTYLAALSLFREFITYGQKLHRLRKFV